MRYPLILLVAWSLAAPAAAAPARPESAAMSEADGAAPELVRLDRQLTAVQQEGRLSSDQYEKFLARFRVDLAAAKAGASPSPSNAAIHARILARLGEFKRAGADLGEALKHDPGSASLRTALSQVRYDEKNYPAALAEADAVLARDPANREALILKHFSMGRVAMNGESGEAHALTPSRARRSFGRRFHFTAADPANLPYKLAIRLAPATAPPDPRSSRGPAPGPFPLAPLAEAAVLGMAAYEVSRRRSAYASADGLDDEHPKPVGRYQRLVAGAILAGALGGVLYTAGAAVVSAAPFALSYATNIGSHGLRLASSEAGALNPGELKAANEIPKLLARVIPYEPGTTIPDTIGLPDRSHAFVTAAEDISGLNAAEISQKLGIEPARQYLVIRFPVPTTGLSTPLTFDHPLFSGGGMTSGGAREFFIANGAFPSAATYQIIK